MSETRRIDRSRMLAMLASLSLAFAIAAGASSARASEGEVVTHLAVFEINSDGVHDELARQLTEELRKEVKATPGHLLSDARVSLEQLSLVHDCDPAELACLGKIARQLGVGGFIHGQLQSEGGGAYAEVRLFDATTQTNKRTARVMFALRDAAPAEVSRKAQTMVAQLLGPESAPAPEAPTTPTPELAPPPADAATGTSGNGISGQRVAGFALLGGAALSVGLSVFAFVEIDRAKNNETYDSYRRAVGRTDPTVKDVCDEAASDRRHGLDSKSFGEVKSECSTGRTFEVLQFVFLGAAAVSGGLSAYLLLSDDGSERKSRALLDGLPIHPVVRRNAAELRARFRF